MSKTEKLFKLHTQTAEYKSMVALRKISDKLKIKAQAAELDYVNKYSEAHRTPEYDAYLASNMDWS